MGRREEVTVFKTICAFFPSTLAAPCEMIAEVLQYFTENIKLEPSEADCIYAGILITICAFFPSTLAAQ